MMRLPVKRLAILSVFTTIGLLVGFLEAIVVIPIGVPGIKLGLSNIISVLLLYMYGPLEAILVLISRILLSGLLFGTGISIIYSLVGGLLSFFLMFLVYRNRNISMIGTSVIGGVFHNVGQICVASFFIMDKRIFMYLPILIISGVLTGIIIGWLSNFLFRRLNGRI